MASSASNNSWPCLRAPRSPASAVDVGAEEENLPAGQRDATVGATAVLAVRVESSASDRDPWQPAARRGFVAQWTIGRPLAVAITISVCLGRVRGSSKCAGRIQRFKASSLHALSWIAPPPRIQRKTEYATNELLRSAAHNAKRDCVFRRGIFGNFEHWFFPSTFSNPFLRQIAPM